jgi:hypothetical protein
MNSVVDANPDGESVMLSSRFWKGKGIYHKRKAENAATTAWLKMSLCTTWLSCIAGWVYRGMGSIVSYRIALSLALLLLRGYHE